MWAGVGGETPQLYPKLPSPCSLEGSSESGGQGQKPACPWALGPDLLLVRCVPVGFLPSEQKSVVPLGFLLGAGGP